MKLTDIDKFESSKSIYWLLYQKIISLKDVENIIEELPEENVEYHLANIVFDSLSISSERKALARYAIGHTVSDDVSYKKLLECGVIVGTPMGVDTMPKVFKRIGEIYKIVCEHVGEQL